MTPASRARRGQSCTAERALPIAVAICRSLKPSALSRKTSRILRTGNLACPTVALLPVGKRDHGSGGYPSHTPRPASTGIRTCHYGASKRSSSMRPGAHEHAVFVACKWRSSGYQPRSRRLKMADFPGVILFYLQDSKVPFRMLRGTSPTGAD